MNNPSQRPANLWTLLDKDPGPWRPLYYNVEISVPVANGGQGRGSVTFNSQPFILTRFHHKIVGCTADPDTTGLYQDGQYDVEWRDENSNYQNQAAGADIQWGSIVGGFAMDLPFPIPFEGNRTLTFLVTNRCLRTLASEAEHFNVQISAHGISYWGKPGVN